ncbi:MAG: segregation and condensation protein A [Paracoccaceae bacterium]
MAESSLHLRLEGFEGPLDLLLELARAQKVDFSKISIVALVDQYIAVIERVRDEGAGSVRLELAAEWLVMAAWLAWLKSRLLVPEEEREGDDPEALAEALADRLVELERIRAASAWLGRRPGLGHDVFFRGMPEALRVEDRSGIAADLPTLLQAYVAGRRRAVALRPYRPKPRRLWSVQEALIRLTRLVGEVPDWAVLQNFLPDDPAFDPVERRAALASTLVAGLEMARGGGIEMEQDQAFGPIRIRRRAEENAADVRAA